MKHKRILSFVLVLSMICSLFVTVPTQAEENTVYDEYLSETEDVYSTKEINLNLNTAKFSAEDVAEFSQYEDREAVVFHNNGGNAVWEFTCEEAGLYWVQFDYFPIKNRKIDIEVGMKIDDSYMYKDMQSFLLTRAYKNDGDIATDSQGNDYNPQQIEAEMWLQDYFRSSSGNYDEPMEIYLSSGTHTFTLESFQEPFALSAVTFVPVKEAVSYATYLDMHEDKNNEEFEEKFEAEKASLKSDFSLLAQTNRSSSKTTPFSYTNQKLNIIGGDSWKAVGQWLEWEIEVPEDGFYYINFRYSQSYNKGLPSNRKLYINGSVPFKEAEELKFKYEPDWEMYSLEIDDEEAKYWLEKGVNTIRLEITLGDIVEITAHLDDIVYNLNSYYRKIIMITGSSPDTYRDYELESEIPELLEQFQLISEDLKSVYTRVGELISGNGDSGNILKVLAFQIDDMIAEPSSIPYRLDSFSSNIGSLSSWNLEIKQQALDLDYIYVTNGDDKPAVNENFFEAIWREIVSFFTSFVTDYNSFEAEDGKESITIWVNTGRDQANIIRHMIDDMFTPETGISVSVKVTSANAMQAFLSDDPPDIMLNVARGLPVNLALRGALYDLTKFDDFKEVTKQFSETATDPYSLDGGVYALPETETYYMMFTRDDVLAELGLDKPQTWEDFYNVVQVLQLNKLQVGVPYTGVDSAAAVDSGVGSKNLFSAFLLQKGGSFYTEDRVTTNLSTAEAVSAFEQWTDLYSKYDIPLSYNFFNRFRTGEMPIGIALYTEYNQLTAAAPEIAGLWSMSPIPGTLQEDGTIDRSQGGSGTSCVITSITDSADASWEFLKWWTGAEAQTRYSSDLEALLGVAGRYATANLEARANQQWTGKEYSVLMEQSEYVTQIPVIAGGYYLTRGIDNAFRDTVYNGRNAKESLIVWDREIASEVLRKREEFYDGK